MRIAAAVAAGLCLAGCEAPPAVYSPPAQRPVFEDTAPHTTRVIEMDDPDAPVFIVRDIDRAAEKSWRWTGRRPAVRLRLKGSEKLKYTIDFTIPEVTFKDTGPVTITFTVNDHVLGRERYASQGHRHFEKAVPPQWIDPAVDVIAGAEIDKLWTSKLDGAQFGFILSRIGLTK